MVSMHGSCSPCWPTIIPAHAFRKLALCSQVIDASCETHESTLVRSTHTRPSFTRILMRSTPVCSSVQRPSTHWSMLDHRALNARGKHREVSSQSAERYRRTAVAMPLGSMIHAFSSGGWRLFESASHPHSAKYKYDIAKDREFLMRARRMTWKMLIRQSAARRQRKIHQLNRHRSPLQCSCVCCLSKMDRIPNRYRPEYSGGLHTAPRER
jgi:hypothetical protein